VASAEATTTASRSQPANTDELLKPVITDATERKGVAATWQLIERGGPYPYDRDGIVFGNFERRLPAKLRGSYHEYTVPTPGVSSRGARRIVMGGPSDVYYTRDHYESFVKLPLQKKESP
jgi:ribonuclease T1